jgi:hypothetical protein
VLRRRFFRRFGALAAEGLVAGLRARCPRSLSEGHCGREQWRVSGFRSCSLKVSGANETGEPNGEPKLPVILFLVEQCGGSRATGTPSRVRQLILGRPGKFDSVWVTPAQSAALLGPASWAGSGHRVG